MKALELIIPKVEDNYKYVEELNNKILNNLKKYDNIHINSTSNSIPYIINFSILNIKPETFIHAMEEENIYIATHSIRISLSCKNTIEEVNKFNEIFDKVINKLLLK